MQKLTRLRMGSLVRIGCAILLAGLAVNIGKAQTNFASAEVLSGDYGSVTVDNTGVVPDSGTPTIAGLPPEHTVWFQWSSTNSGEVEIDTIGSVDDSGLTNLDTVLGVYTGTSLAALDLVSANDNLYPNYQYNEAGQNIYTTGDTNYNQTTNPPPVQAHGIFGDIYQPYAGVPYSPTGPSGLRFNAVAGTTYYFAVDTRSSYYYKSVGGLGFSGLNMTGPGMISLNWSLHPSGVFRFATENADVTGLTYPDGTPLLLYQTAATESSGYSTTAGDPIRYPAFNDANGVLVTVTRVAGAYGRVRVDYTTADLSLNTNLMGTNGFLINGDLPAVAYQDYFPASGTLTFDDYEMSKTILIEVENSGPPRPNRDFGVVLSNAQLDPSESIAVSPPRVDAQFGEAMVRILDVNVDPNSGMSFADVTNVPAGNTNTVRIYSTTPTNSVFNFQKENYRVYRVGTNQVFTIYVNRTGTNTAATTIDYNVNSTFPYEKDYDAPNDDYKFPLTPGSDYATPDPKDSAAVFGRVPDFIFPGGYSGTISWGDKDFNPKPITFTVYNNGLQQFNEDFQINLYNWDSYGNPFQVGMVNNCTVTILNASELDNNYGTSNINPPAGAVDELYNVDYGSQFWLNTDPPQMENPGADGVVYGLALQPDGKTIVVGDFFSYDLTGRNCIARATASGYLDTTFDPGEGADDFISCVALTTNNEALIGGNFTSYNGTLRNGIALVKTNGALDTSFYPGLGFNGTVYAVAMQTNGQVLVGGDFTTYNGATANHIARLNLDGSLDPTFNPGTILTNSVNAIAVQPNGQIVVGGDFTAVGGVAGQNYVTRLNANGSLDNIFDPGNGANGSVYAVGIQPDGNIVIGGNFTQVNGQNLNGIARLTGANGALDTGFYGGIGVDGPVYSLTVQTNAIYATTNSSVVVQTNFTIYVGGAFTEYNGTHRLGFARLNADGTIDTSFLDTAYNQFAGLTREYFGDPVGAVLTSAVQPNGDVLIGGSFDQVGGGEFYSQIRPDDYFDPNVFTSIITRSAVRNRSNIARLHGGATDGPGNVGLNYSSYSVNKSAASLFVGLVRTNGDLGPAAANFSAISGLAQNGVDYFYDGDYNGTSPLYWILWEYRGPTRMHSDGLIGQNAVPTDNVLGDSWSGASDGYVNLTVTSTTNSYNNLSAQFQLSNPAADQFYLGGEDIPLGVGLGLSSAPLTLIEDRHQSGTFGFAASSYTSTNSPASIGITRTNGNYGQVTVFYATTTNGSTAISGTDYTPISGSTTFLATDTNKTFNVTIKNTTSISSVEKTVNLLLTGITPPVNGIASLGLANAVLRIINPNFQGFLNLSTNAYAANLSAGSATITVTRTVGSKGTLTVQCATTNGTAVSGTDYIGFTNTLAWNSGDVTPRVITIPLLNNGLVGVGKQFGVSIFNPMTNGVGMPSLFASNGTTNAVVVINNDNSYGTFQFNAPGYIVNENGGYSTITVTRTGSTNGTASVQFATANGTAFAGTNYTGITNTLIFAPGQLATNVNVPVLNDGVGDPSPFFFTVSLSSPGSGASLGFPTMVTNYIVDSQTNNVPPGNGDTTFNTGTGMNGDVLALTLQSSGKIIAGGNFTTVNGVPENYLARLNPDGTLDTTGFLHNLAGANGYVYALADQTDDQILAGGDFTSFNGIVRNRIVRLNTDGSIDTSFNPGAGADNIVYCIAEAFINGARKIYLGGAFSTENGVSHPNLVRLNNNGTVDGGFAPGAGPNSPVYTVAVYPTNSVFAGKLLVGGAFTNINNFAVGHVARLNADGSMDTNFDLNLSASDAVRAIAVQNDGRILIGGDFTNVDGVALNHIARLNADGTVDTNFTAGVGVGANGTVNAITLQADGRIVVVGQFTQANGVTRNHITRLWPTGATDPTIDFGDGANGSIAAVVVQPADQNLVIGGAFTQYNDQPANGIERIYGGSMTGSGAFEFTSANFQADENGIVAPITIRRTGGTSGTNADGSGDVFVQFTTSDGTATNGVNYLSVAANVDFPAGEVVKTIVVPVLDDFVVTPTLTVNLALSNPTPPAGLGDQPTAILNLVNVDSTVAFSSAFYSQVKNTPTGVAVIDVLRLGGTNGTSTVDFYTTTNGTAVIGTDYYPTNATLTFNPGQSDVQIQVPIINNSLPEGNKLVGLLLTNAVNTTLTAPTNATLTIIDTVAAPGQLYFSATNFTAGSGDGNAYLTVLRTNGSSGSVSLTYSTVPGTALPGLNYVSTINTLTFGSGETVKYAAVPLVNNNIAQVPVSLSVVLSNPTGGATLTAPTNATLTILNTNIGFAFLNATNYVRETNGLVPIFVQRIGGTNGGVQVNYSTTAGTALPGVNYTTASGTLTFGAGEMLQAVSLPLIYDPKVTGDLNLTMQLSSPSAGTALASPSNTLVVVEDADAGLSFTNPAMSVFKNVGNAVIPVVCTNPAVEPVMVDSNTVPMSVHYFTADGTALAGVDYQATNGVLVFTNGIGTNFINVPVYNNSQVLGNHTFSVSLFNPTAPGQLVAPSNQVVTIVDNNSGLSFSSPVYTVLKTGVSAAITVLRTDNTNTTSSVHFATADGSAAAGTDYLATNGVLVFTNGQTSQTFAVTVIANTTVQPDKTVLLQLSNPTNGFLIAPYAATLTIHDNSGSLVVPAGSTFAPGGNPDNNGLIDPGETVTLLFALRASGGNDVTNLSASLQAGGGITAPTSPNGTATQSYGNLIEGGPSASRPFTFTASGTNSQFIAATFQLQDSATNNLGTAVFTYTLGTWTATFYNTNGIIINDVAIASPYPSGIVVTNVGGVVIKSVVTLTNLYHGYTKDIQALVASPAGQDTLLMGHAGNGSVAKITLTFDDAATNSLSSTNGLVTGTNQPTAYPPTTIFP
jgi:uncharacterized delta-60 repeat protein